MNRNQIAWYSEDIMSGMSLKKVKLRIAGKFLIGPVPSSGMLLRGSDNTVHFV